MSSKQQGYFNFTRGNKLHILREIAPLMPHSRMTRTLRAIDERHWQFARDQSTVTLTHRQIASYDGMSVPTARRGIADLMEHNLLIKKQIVTSHGQQANSYQIVWSNLDAIVNDGEPLTEPAPVPAEFTVDNSETPAPVLDDELTQVVKVGGDHCDHPPDHHDQPPDHSDQPPPDHHDQASIYPLININNHPPSHNPKWLVVENDLRSLGVGRAVQAVATAQGRGCSAEEIQRLIAYARSKPGAYGPGAICKRVTEAFPGRDLAEGWPPEDPEYQKGQRQKRAQDERVQGAQGVAEIQSRRKANQQARQTLEQNFGPLLDRLSEAERNKLARQCGTIVFQKMNRDPAAFQSGDFRLFLLTKLKARQAECLVNSTSADVEGSAFVE